MPSSGRRLRHGGVAWLARFAQGSHTSPEAEYFAERELKRHWPWRAYTALVRWTSGLDPLWTPPRPPPEPFAAYWFDRYEPADASANEYAARYRSAYVWIFLLGTFAVIFGAVALVIGLLHPPAAWLGESFEVLKLIFALAELAALSLILTLVVLGIRREWHEHSIEYRLLAELCRKQQALAPLGWALPITTVRRMSTSDRPTPDRAAWVAWLFAAQQRAAPLPRGELAQAAAGAPRRAVLDDLIAGQRAYHKARAEMAERAAKTLERWGAILFGIVFCCVLLKLLLEAMPASFCFCRIASRRSLA